MTNVTTGARTDAIELLSDQHREIEQLWEQAERACRNGDHDLTRHLVDRLITLLSQHDAIEAQVLYPTLRGLGARGDELTDHSLHQHQIVRELLHEVDGKDHRDTEVWVALARCMHDVFRHAQEEEQQAFPMLRTLGQETLDELGDTMQAVMPLAPTHPHPSTPDSGLGATVVGPIMGAVDKVRDALRPGG
jgi:hemerythrin superfamily protein